jgi:hypothetical protein
MVTGWGRGPQRCVYLFELYFQVIDDEAEYGHRGVRRI